MTRDPNTHTLGNVARGNKSEDVRKGQRFVSVRAAYASGVRKICCDGSERWTACSPSRLRSLLASASRHGGCDPVGEKEIEPFQFTFNGFLSVVFWGSQVTSDAGLILVRELTNGSGWTRASERLPSRTEHAMLVGGSPAATIYSRLPSGELIACRV